MAWLGKFVLVWIVLAVLAVLAAEAYDQSLIGKVEGLLASAHEHFGEGEGVSLHLKSEMAFKDALKIYQYSHARSHDDIRAPAATGAILRLLRLPLMVCSRSFNCIFDLLIYVLQAIKTYVLGYKLGSEWKALHRDLKAYAKKLRTARMAEMGSDPQMEGTGWKDE
jgi:hypothetical protein